MIIRSTKTKACNKCGENFPYKMIINGKIRSFQHRKFCLVCSPYGAGNNRNLAKTNKVCKRCNRSLSLDAFYWKGKTSTLQPYCKQCMLEYNAERKRKIKQQAVEYKGGKCSICGYDKCLAALDFHHRNPSEKDLNIAHSHIKFDKLKSELDKCDLLCCRCHREVHVLSCTTSTQNFN